MSEGAGPSSAELMASGAISSGSSPTVSSSNLGSGDSASASQEIMPPVVSSQGLSILGTEKSGGLGGFLQNPALGVPGAGSGNVLETDLDTVTSIAPGNVAMKMLDDVNGLGSLELNNTGIAKQTNANLPNLNSGQAQQH